MQDVVACCLVVIATLIVGEVVLHWRDGELFSETINLVQEQNDRSLDEPPRVANAIKQSQSLLHTVHGLILEKQLIVFGNGDKEENGRNIFEAVDPLFTFRSLTTDVKHAIRQLANDEGRLRDTSSLDTRSENVLVRGKIVALGNSVDRVKVARWPLVTSKKREAD